MRNQTDFSTVANAIALRIETCDKGAFCGARENVRYQMLLGMPLLSSKRY